MHICNITYAWGLEKPRVATSVRAPLMPKFGPTLALGAVALDSRANIALRHIWLGL